MPDPVDNTVPAFLYEVAKGCKERASALEYRGKRRDVFALDYFCGAATAYNTVGDTQKGQHIERVITFLLSTRGYREVEEILKKEPRP